LDLTHARIQAELDTARYGRSLTLVEVTGSTNDDARAAALALWRTLFRRLEDEQDLSGEFVPHAGQNFGGCECDGDVRIMSARVHHADCLAPELRLDRGFEGHIRLLGDRQRVHVGAQCDRPARLRASKQSDHASPGDPGMNFEPECFQAPGYHFRGAHFPVAQFRMGVKVAPPFDHPGLDGARRCIYLFEADLGSGRGGEHQGDSRKGDRSHETTFLRRSSKGSAHDAG